MCGRYELHAHPDVIALQFGVANVPPIGARFNIAPQTAVPVVRIGREGGRELAMLRWGLVPFWAKDPSIGAKMINARAETVLEKPAYRDAFRRHRCLLPANAFYEWKAGGARKQPMRVASADGRLLALAGLYDRWRDPSGAMVETCTILTTDANADVATIHARMPVLISPGDYSRWLAGSVDEAAGLLTAPPPGGLGAHPVSLRVNDARNDDPSLIEPLPGLDGPRPA